MEFKTSNEALEIFNKLRPVKWQYNKIKNLGDKIHFGFIAQELQELGKDYAFVDDSGEYLKVNYTEFIGILTSVVKQQQQEINILKEEISKIQDKGN